LVKQKKQEVSQDNIGINKKVNINAFLDIFTLIYLYYYLSLEVIKETYL